MELELCFKNKLGAVYVQADLFSQVSNANIGLSSPRVLSALLGLTI